MTQKVTIQDFITPRWKWNPHNMKRQYETTDSEEIEKLRKAWTADMQRCGCDPSAFGPPHGRSFVYNGKGITSQCESFCRWYNPKTGEVEGNAHCACGTCFD